ncbi:hypothetical protein LIER_32657 [Lithospermum erythrorhizon]|uniref:F-box domain-containing protein n=1 Tax=Lithospermum erythrorhizon TaxID=34254 RepID=A0AAV3RWP6_LITER
MGSSFSFFPPLFTFINQPSPHPHPCLGDLPESCVASILMNLEPKDICKVSLLNKAFRDASFADFVWELKLPLNYEALTKRVFHDFDDNEGVEYGLCKKDVFARLCEPNSFDGGTKRAWLDKSTGKVCLSMASSALAITGMDDRRYWTRIQTDESRFHSVAYLQQMWWFEVDGEVEFPFPPGCYSLFFRLQLGLSAKRFYRRMCSTEHVHGWDIKPVRFQISTSDGQESTSQCYLREPGRWIFYHAGDFSVNPSKSTKVKFSMTQIDCTHTKGGLCVDSVLIYPGEFKERLKRV